ncbi:hypothetical protein ASPACDRAFT_44902 [Aspergillus aculeatus ATCC 16872]|uniref:Uncharacterized protein n=1 Tax=Aspergillus aculeatus (strain ATCC 16872 / CBS 172.66 / WB 5094) TaxID=690307 RepID=A0A1L9WQE6_ASPA1|nr:uncharacterized protein ASPACDRAFT_44902 [Aspergillus aculeatus ATCC 16872]OJJ98399.1 hypothetical protein ASPACDRAFT_44902 [Aspergillus aculeatus ATCC 16872]
MPEITETTRVDEKITAMAHDYFFPQPVRGVHNSSMHAALHDWLDDKAKQNSSTSETR